MKHFKFINKLIVLTVITSSIFTTIAKADEVSNNDNATFLNAVYEKGEYAQNTDDTLYASVNASDFLVLRTDSNAKADEITRLPYGYNLTVLGAKNGWVQVKNDDDMIGYVNGKYLDFHFGTKPENKVETVTANSKTQSIVDYAQKYIGTPYLWGGTNLNVGVDCSGLVYSSYKAYGITLNRTSRSMFNQGVAVKKSDLQTGDLVFFNTSGAGISHVGMYVGNNNFIEAADSGVKLTSLSSPYATRTYVGAKRIILD